jgi:hypothetical protein
MTEVERELIKQQELIHYLENRVNLLQEEAMRSVPLESYETLKRTHESQVNKLNDDLASKVKFLFRISNHYQEQIG